MVSPQHCVVVGDSFVRARHLAEIPGSGARVAQGVTRVEYFHVLCEQHQVLIAEGMHTESFHPGPNALRALGGDALARLKSVVPGLLQGGKMHEAKLIGPTARPVLRRRDLCGVPHHDELSALA